ncbi:MAG: PD40 domain-containing protein [Phycisphaerales bacterium]|nr:PD40 domain-containing protein [Phycisphaerales bacterium]
MAFASDRSGNWDIWW